MSGCADATLAVLAGGEGSRMGMAKGELRVGGLPILEFLMSRLKWDGPTLLVTGPGREKPPGHDLFKYEVTDLVRGQGPLRGLDTALEVCGTELLVVATVDMPLVAAGHLEWLVAELARREGCLGLMLQRGTPARFEPFPSAWRVEARRLVEFRLGELRLGRGERSMRSLTKHKGVVVADAPAWDESTWTNLNRPEDLRDFVATLR